jgi:hypothetical protein
VDTSLPLHQAVPFVPQQLLNVSHAIPTTQEEPRASLVKSSTILPTEPPALLAQRSMPTVSAATIKPSALNARLAIMSIPITPAPLSLLALFLTAKPALPPTEVSVKPATTILLLPTILFLVLLRRLAPKQARFSMEPPASAEMASSTTEQPAKPALRTALPAHQILPVLPALPSISCQVGLAWPAPKTASPAPLLRSARSATLASRLAPRALVSTAPQRTWRLRLWAALPLSVRQAAQDARQRQSALAVFRASLCLDQAVSYATSLAQPAQLRALLNAHPAHQVSTSTPESASNVLTRCA